MNPFKLNDIGRCSGRPGILQLKNKDGSWDSVAVNLDGTPHVFDCEHEAISAAHQLIGKSMELYLLSESDAYISPDEFRYTFVDETDKVMDKPVDSHRLDIAVSALDVIEKAMGRT